MEQLYIKGRFLHPTKDTLDRNYDLISNCYAKVAYSTLKQNPDFDENMYFNQIVNCNLFCLALDETYHLLDFYPLENNQNHYFQFRELPVDIDFRKSIESAIDQYGYVAYQSIEPLINYMLYYNLDYNKENYSPGHVALLVGYDEKHYYYYEPYDVINKKHFIAYPENPDVGMISRDELDNVFAQRLKLFVVDLCNIENTIVHKNMIALFASGSKHWVQEIVPCANTFSYYGKQAVKKLDDLFNEGLDISSSSKRFAHKSIGQMLSWRFGYLKNNVKVLLHYFERTLDDYTYSGKKALFSALDQSIKIWGRLSSKLYKYDRLAKTRLGTRVDVSIELANVVEIESELALQLAAVAKCLEDNDKGKGV